MKLDTLQHEETIHLTVDGVDREALIFWPGAIAQPTTVPLVFAFHGHGGTMASAASEMHLQVDWPSAIVVYPQGLKTPSHIDPSGHSFGWEKEANQAAPVGNRDLRLFDELLHWVGQHHPVNPKQIYVTGFSNGALFSYLLWAERGNVVAAVGACAGKLESPPEQLTVPRPLLAIAGEADTVCPFPEQMATMAAACALDHAASPGLPQGQYGVFYASPIGTPVKTFIHPGAHIYPTWAPEHIVKFFVAHPQP